MTAADESRIPTRITPCPIHEAIFELRFASSLGSEIPGLMYSEFRDRYQTGRDLAVAQIPTEIRESDPNLRYQPVKAYRCEGFLLRVGPRVVSLSTRPFHYPGWSGFAPEIRSMLTAMRNLRFVDEVERLGLRYFNFFDHDVFANLKLRVELGDAPLDTAGLYVQTRFQHESFRCLTQVINPAFAKTPGRSIKGSVVDLDVSREGGLEGFMDDPHRVIDEAHRFEKRCFFQLLTAEYLATLNPEY